jgi:hypothetical protein
VFAPILHLGLIAVLIGCPYLCSQCCAGGCCAGGCATEPSCGDPSCEHCPAAPAREEPHRPSDKCTCDCLCKGAVSEPKAQVDLAADAAACTACLVIVNARGAVEGAAVVLRDDDVSPPSGRALRTLLAALTC